MPKNRREQWEGFHSFSCVCCLTASCLQTGQGVNSSQSFDSFLSYQVGNKRELYFVVITPEIFRKKKSLYFENEG